MKNIITLLILVTLIASCKKDNDSPSGSNADYYFIGMLDGGELKFEIEASSIAEMIISNDASLNPPDNCTYSYGCGIGTNFGEPSEKSINITFPSLFSGSCGDELTTFSGLFPERNYVFGENSGQVTVIYFDGTEQWASFNDTQTGASFEITASEVVESGFGNSQKVSGKLTCRVFNDSGDSKILEEVTFALSFWPWT